MNATVMVADPRPQAGIRARIVSQIKAVPDRDTRQLLKDILTFIDSPYDLSWMREEYRLSEGEMRVLQHLVEGKGPKQISEVCGTALATVRVHIYNIYKKVRVSNMAELMAVLLQRPHG